MARRWSAGTWIAVIAVSLWTLAIFVPFMGMVLSSLKSNLEIFQDPFGIDLANLKLENFADAWAGPGGGRPLATYFVNSVIASSVSLVLGISVGTLAAYALARSRGAASRWVHVWFVVLLTVPVLVTLVPLFDLTGALGIRNSVFGIALIYAALIVPTTVILMRAYFVSFPLDLIESARLDGLSEMGSFWRVVLPLSQGPLIGVTVVNLLFVWSELALAVVLLLTPDGRTLPVGLTAFKGQYATDFGIQYAGLVIATAPVVLVYVVFQRFITRGVALGAMR
jgi:ABC-type glycerol-3-phosphate transport system permease component